MSSIDSFLTAANSLFNSRSTPRHANVAVAMYVADIALQRASEETRPKLAARAELLRGHCLREMGQWSEASGCYERASSRTSSGTRVIDGAVSKK